MTAHAAPARSHHLWRGPLAVWLTLMALLALNVAVTFAPLGAGRTAANLLIAGLMVALLAVTFMRLDRATHLVRLAAAAGVLWASFLFLLAGADILARS